MKRCRHCGTTQAVNRPRGLCWTCFYRPGVRDRYPPTSKYARHGVAFDNVATKPTPAPTRALPGTSDKVTVLQTRAEQGLALWHPYDARAEVQ